MKIALVSPYDLAYPGGVKSHVLHLAAEFAKKEHDIQLLAPCARGTTEISGFRVMPLGRSVPVPAGGSIAHLSFSVWKDRRIRALLRSEAFDIVHVHEPFMPFLPWQVVWASPATTVGTFHAFNERTRRLLIWKPLLRYTARRLDGRIAVSRAALKYVSRHFSGEYTVIPNGVDVDWFSQHRPPLPELDDGRINILFVGRAEKRKGLIYLLGAFSRLRWTIPNLRLIVVGPGNPDRDAAALIAERGVEDVVFTGPVGDDMLPRYHHSAHIFCSPSIGRESFGMVLAEAMAASLPIVATNIEGHASVINHGEQGLLVNPRDEVALEGGLRMLIEDTEFRRRLGAVAREKVEEYRWERVAQRVMNYYQSIPSTFLRDGRDGALVR